MLALMGAAVLILVAVGPAALTGHPALIVLGTALGALVLFLTRRGRRGAAPAGRH